MKEICKTYFEYEEKIINGYKVTEGDGEYNVYVFTSCKKLNNWQLILTYKSFDKVIKYFKNLVQRDIEEQITYEDDHTNYWVSKEKQWRKDTLEMLLKSA